MAGVTAYISGICVGVMAACCRAVNGMATGTGRRLAVTGVAVSASSCDMGGMRSLAVLGGMAGVATVVGLNDRVTSRSP